VAEQLSFFVAMPSYHQVIAREGVASAVDLAAVGSAESVRPLRFVPAQSEAEAEVAMRGGPRGLR